MKSTHNPHLPLLALALIALVTASACAHISQPEDFVGTWEGMSSMLFFVEDPASRGSNSHELFFESLAIAPEDGDEAGALSLSLDAGCAISGKIDADGELEFEPQECTSEDAHLSSRMMVWGEAVLDGEDEVEILLDGTITYVDEDAAREVNARLRYHFRGSRR